MRVTTTQFIDAYS